MAQGHGLFDANGAKTTMLVVMQVGAANAAIGHLHLDLLRVQGRQLALLEETLKTRNQSVELQTDRYQAGIIGYYDLRTAEAERAAADKALQDARITLSQLAPQILDAVPEVPATPNEELA